MTDAEPADAGRAAYDGMTVRELVELHDASRPDAPLGTWKRSRAKLIERVEALGTEARDDAEAKAAEDAAGTIDEADGRSTASDPEPGGPRRKVGLAVEELLTDPSLDYAAIVERVVAEFPDARTSRRSVASVAAALRRRGVEVPSRGSHAV